MYFVCVIKRCSSDYDSSDLLVRGFNNNKVWMGVGWVSAMIVCILVVCIHLRIDIYLIRVGYTYIRTCGLSISQRLPCPQPYELLLGWQSC